MVDTGLVCARLIWGDRTALTFAPLRERMATALLPGLPWWAPSMSRPWLSWRAL